MNEITHRDTVIVLLKSDGFMWLDADAQEFTDSIWKASKFTGNDAAILVTRLNAENPQDDGKFCATEPLAVAAKRWNDRQEKLP
jgi:hypothetical protein